MIISANEPEPVDPKIKPSFVAVIVPVIEPASREAPFEVIVNVPPFSTVSAFEIFKAVAEEAFMVTLLLEPSISKDFAALAPLTVTEKWLVTSTFVVEPGTAPFQVGGDPQLPFLAGVSYTPSCTVPADTMTVSVPLSPASCS